MGGRHLASRIVQRGADCPRVTLRKVRFICWERGRLLRRAGSQDGRETPDTLHYSLQATSSTPCAKVPLR